MTNEEYAKARAALIPQAETYTDKVVTKEKYKNASEYKRTWDKTFMRKMDSLAKGAGLI